MSVAAACAPELPTRMGHGHARSMGKRRLTPEELAEKERIDVELPALLRAIPRPRTHADCAAVPRPCPFVSCRHHLYLDETHSGAVKLLFPDRDPSDMLPARSCTLDIVEANGTEGASFPQIAKAINASMQRAEQITNQALTKLRAHPDGPALLEALAHVEGVRGAGAAVHDRGEEKDIAGPDFVDALREAAARLGVPEPAHLRQQRASRRARARRAAGT